MNQIPYQCKGSHFWPMSLIFLWICALSQNIWMVMRGCNMSIEWLFFLSYQQKKMKLKLLFKDWHSSKIFQISPHFNQTILKRLRIFVVSILMLPAKWCRPKCECVTSATLLPPIWWLLLETVKTPEKRPKNDWYMSCAVWIPFFLFTYIDSFMQLSCVYICASQ